MFSTGLQLKVSKLLLLDRDSCGIYVLSVKLSESELEKVLPKNDTL